MIYIKATETHLCSLSNSPAWFLISQLSHLWNKVFKEYPINYITLVLQCLFTLSHTDVYKSLQ